MKNQDEKQLSMHYVFGGMWVCDDLKKTMPFWMICCIRLNLALP